MKFVYLFSGALCFNQKFEKLAVPFLCFCQSLAVPTKPSITQLVLKVFYRRHDPEHNDTTLNDIQHNGTQVNDIQHYNKFNATLSMTTLSIMVLLLC